MGDRDYEGREVLVDETPDTIIKVWEITTQPAPDYDYYLIRGWQEMLTVLREKAEWLLENQVIDEEHAEITIRVRLVEITKGELDDIEVEAE